MSINLKEKKRQYAAKFRSKPRTQQLLAKPCIRCGVCERNKRGDCKACARKHKLNLYGSHKDSILKRRKELHAIKMADPVLKDAQRAKRRILSHKPIPTIPEPSHCECCGRAAIARSLHLDHNHVTGEFRGWLCAACNPAIGALGDTLEGVLRAAAYLSACAKRSSLASNDSIPSLFW